MRPKTPRNLAVVLLGLLQLAVPPVRADEVLIDGLAWRQLTDTSGANLSWSDVASVCPLNETPCSGVVNGVDFTGWTWASASRVNRMLDIVTGLRFPAEPGDLDSSVELFFDTFDPIFLSDDGISQFSHGLHSESEVPADGRVNILEVRETSSASGSDRMIQQEIGVDDVEASSFFGPQPLGVYLVRDPELELCGNGIDDNGNGDVDTDDDGCAVDNPVIDGREWRQVTATQGLAWIEVATVCPLARQACSGALGNVNFDGWTWASGPEIQDMVESLTGYRIGSDPGRNRAFPPDSAELGAMFGAFAPTQILPGNEAIYGLGYNSMGEFPSDWLDVNSTIDPETCTNGIDDDGDGKIDTADPNCLGSQFFSFQNVLGASGQDRMGQLSGSGQNPFYGHFFYREPEVKTAESCDNSLDDDGDGLVDGQDTEDCGDFAPLPFIVSCTHDPIYSDSDTAEFTITARALDETGVEQVVDTVEIWTSADTSAAETSTSDAAVARYVFTPGESFSYNCSATLGGARYSSGWRRVTVGAFNSPWPAIPILVNGSVAEKIDIVFLRDEDDYDEQDDPDFIRDVGLLIKGGYFSIPWFVRHQSYFNFWLGDDTANSGPDPDDDDPTDGTRCLREAPGQYARDYSFADSGAIVHREACRDNAGNGLFTVEVQLRRLQVAAHETGHRPFGLADEYCCDGGYYSRAGGGAPYHNMFANEDDCVAAAEDREYDPDLCRGFVEDDDEGEDWWLFEPDFGGFNPEERDLMQGTGCESLTSRADCKQIAATTTDPGENPNGQVACADTLDTHVGNVNGPGDRTYWICTRMGNAANAVWEETDPKFQRIEPRDSELDRMQWYLSECDAGRC